MTLIMIYLIIALLNLGLVILIDLLGGDSLATSLHSIFNVFEVSTLQEYILMIAFLLFPIVHALNAQRKRGNS